MAMPEVRATAVALLITYRKMTARRDSLIRDAHRAGLSKREIHEHSGLARTTIDRILGRPDG